MFGRGGSQHGFKRRASDKDDDDREEFGIDQPITKRLARMRIGQDHPTFQSSKISVSISSSSPSPRSGRDQQHDHAAYSYTDEEVNDQMHVDDTPNRVFIHSLDSEIAQIEADEAASTAQAIFPADIDKKISAIPQRLLQNKTDMNGTGASDTQMVLYHVPSSISVADGEQDAVKTAIMASRARAREEQDKDAEGKNGQDSAAERPEQDASRLMPDVISQSTQAEEMDDPDAMDLG